MNGAELNEATRDFLRIHRHDDVRQLALQATRHPDVDMPWALDQLRGRQLAANKLPSWANHDGIVYPPHISMEQCSSEQTARYKQELVRRLLSMDASATKKTMADLTGGFGVDFSFLAPLFAEATYVERQPHLCDTMRHNAAVLGLANATIENADSIDFLQQLGHTTLLYIDPARRDEHGRKTYSIKDCTPDVAQLCPTLLDRADWLLVKLSPMLDWHEAVRELGGVREVHIVSVANECKELLIVCSKANGQPLRVVCANDGQRFEYVAGERENTSSPIVCASSSTAHTTLPHTPLSSLLSPLSSLPTPLSSLLSPLSSLFVPNASIMKAGCFDELCKACQLRPLAANSHLFVREETSDETADFGSFPGRTFRIEAVTTMNKKELRHTLSGIDRANIAVRNFPLTADQLRKRLKLKDGGDIYIFGTTVGKADHILIITKKAR